MALQRPPPPPPTIDLVPGESPEDVHPIRLARLLADKWPTLNEATRRVIRNELEDGGLLSGLPGGSGPAGAGSPASAPASPLEKLVTLAPHSAAQVEHKIRVVRTKMRTPDSHAGEPVNLVELLQLISELVGHVIQMGDKLNVVGATWQNLASGRRVGPASTAIQPLLEQLRAGLQPGAAEALRPVLREQLESVRLLVSILIGVSQGSRQFADELCKDLDHEVIRQELRQELLQQRRTRPPTDAELWQFYTQRTDALSPGEIEDKLIKRVVEAVYAVYHVARGG